MEEEMKRSVRMLFLYALIVSAVMARMMYRITTVAAGVPAAEEETACSTWIAEEYQGYCRKIGAEYGICPELLMAMIERESSGNADAFNSAGDFGLLQVNQSWHYERMEKLGVTDLYDPYSNILVAADYLKELFEEHEDLYIVLMKYNMNHKMAETLYSQGNYSEYAIEVAERAWELEQLHEKGSRNEETDSH